MKEERERGTWIRSKKNPMMKAHVDADNFKFTFLYMDTHIKGNLQKFLARVLILTLFYFMRKNRSYKFGVGAIDTRHYCMCDVVVR